MFAQDTPISAPNEPAYALLAQLHRRAFEPQGDSVWGVAAFRQLIESPGVGTCLFERDSQPCGFYMYRIVLDEAELISIAVDPSFQGKGLSGSMMDHMLAKLRQQAIERLFLEVRKDNKAAIKLYENQGFSITGLRKNYYKIDGGKKIDALIFALNL